ncbi:sigma-54-dependent transcriptional regulator [Candidatus Latescibacterota bacterium]
MSDKNHKILVVDNDKAICWVLEKAFTDEDYIVDVAMNGKKALEMIKNTTYTTVIMDIMMPVMDGLTALKHIRKLTNPPETIIITAHSNMENTVEAMKLGAFDFIVKPFDIDDMLSLAGRAVDKYKARAETTKRDIPDISGRIIGDSPVMRELYKMLGRVASTDSSVLLTGETGTGKDLFARAIHSHSARREKPMVTVNCASIPGELLESELFGHVRGAFTGATGDRAGKCMLADSGTLFLDEIGTMRLDLQAKLLRFLQRSEFEPVGTSETIHVDARVIAATNADLKKITERGLFREDLYYRLMVVPIHIPPMRERKEDIPALAKYFVDHYNAKYDLNFKLTKELIKVLKTKNWPGNVRELENYIHRMVVLQSDIREINENVSLGISMHKETDNIDKIVSELIDSEMPHILDIARERIEKPLVAKVMSRAGDNQSEAAKILGVSRNTLKKMLTKYGMI